MGQSSQFTSLESDINSNISKNNWENVIMLASDLIIEATDKADGYYYTALAFFKMNDLDKANFYLKKAEQLPTVTLGPKMIELSQKLKNEKDAITLTIDGDKTDPNYWISLWELDKKKTEYALNAVELYLQDKRYLEAVAILESSEFKSEQGANEILARIRKTPEMKKHIAITQHLNDGKKAMEREDFDSAIGYFKKAKEINENHTEASKLLKEAEDENAWFKAKTENTIESFEKYLKVSTNQKHAVAANEIIKKSLIKWGEKYARDNDIANMELFLNKYFDAYPFDDEVIRLKQLLCSVYLANGKEQSSVKTYTAQQNALLYFTKTSQTCPEKRDELKDDIQKANRLIKRYGRDDRSYMCYLRDSLSPIGFSTGSINNRKMGGYFSIGINKNIFTEQAYYTINDAGAYDGERPNDIRPTNVKKMGTFTSMIGLTKKITYPLWAYAGAGIAHQIQLQEAEIFDSYGDYSRTDWIKNTQHTFWQPAFETGLIVDLKGFFVRGGIKGNNFSERYYTFGIGFSFSRY
jgi:tetratricopeptide (TPR) repeat protein